MRRFGFILAFLLIAPCVDAQGAFDLTTPITQSSVARYRVETVKESRTGPIIGLQLSALTSGDVLLPQSLWLSFTIPSPAAAQGGPCTSALTISGYMGARSTAVGGEPAGNAAKQNYRVIDYLRAQGCFPAGSMNGS